MNQIVLDALNYVIDLGIVTLVGFLCTQVFHWVGITRLKKVQKLIDTHKAFALEAVKYVEQAFGNFAPGTKLDRGVKYLVTVLSQHKISVSQAEAEQLIEAALKDLKLAWGNEWKNEKNVLNASTPQE